jgi:hypothetical protein
MKTKNHAGQVLPGLAITKAANEDGFAPEKVREPAGGRKQSWSPLEVWRTRVKSTAPQSREPA